jgi:hypothetical protein
MVVEEEGEVEDIFAVEVIRYQELKQLNHKHGLVEKLKDVAIDTTNRVNIKK